MTCRSIDATTVTLEDTHLDRAQVIDGDPAVAAAALLEAPGLEVGVWEHTAGTSTDIEADEVFVVLGGRATVTIEDGPSLELRAGSVGFLDAGARTTWTVHETLRKVYVLR